MLLGQATVEEQLNTKGEANFKELPPSFRLSKVHIYLIAPDVEMIEVDKEFDLSAPVITIRVRPIKESAYKDFRSTIKDKEISAETSNRPSLVKILPGSFIMGSPINETSRETEETQHRVNISYILFVGSTVITQAQYRLVMNEDPVSSRKTKLGRKCSEMGLGDRYPVVCINWREAIEFCNRLSQVEGLAPAYSVGEKEDVTLNLAATGYRLLTEAEWEFAARARTTSAYWFGGSEAMLSEMAWTRENSGHIGHPVASKPANPWGLFEMHGNVWQMTWDLYEEYHATEQTNPLGALVGELRIWRGRSWFAPASQARSAYRFRCAMECAYGDLSFRITRTVAPIPGEMKQ